MNYYESATVEELKDHIRVSEIYRTGKDNMASLSGNKIDLIKRLLSYDRRIKNGGYTEANIYDLQRMCKAQGLSMRGNKQELTNRLIAKLTRPSTQTQSTAQGSRKRERSTSLENPRDNKECNIQPPPLERTQEVWVSQLGQNNVGECPVCGKEINFLSDNWGNAYVKPFYTGGTNQPDNLRPLCINCISAMGNLYMAEFCLNIKKSEAIRKLKLLETYKSTGLNN